MMKNTSQQDLLCSALRHISPAIFYWQVILFLASLLQGTRQSKHAGLLGKNDEGLAKQTSSFVLKWEGCHPLIFHFLCQTCKLRPKFVQQFAKNNIKRMLDNFWQKILGSNNNILLIIYRDFFTTNKENSAIERRAGEAQKDYLSPANTEQQ